MIKQRILVILSRFPYPLEKGDKLRAYYQLKELSATFDIVLLAMHEHPISEQELNEVKHYCSEVHTVRITLFSKLFNIGLALLNGKPLQTGYFHRYKAKRLIKEVINHQPITHIYCQLIRTTEYVKDIHNIPKTLDYMDAFSFGVKRRLQEHGIFTRWIYRMEASRLTRYEQKIFDYFEYKTIISEQDRDLIAHPDKDQIICIPNGIDPEFLSDHVRNEHYDLVFVGNMNYPPNVDAVTFIAEKILPSLKGKTLLIAGANPNSKVIRLGDRNTNITVSGWMDDIKVAYLSGRIFLAPMRIGTGMQNKLLEAMALGTPCITTSLANNAIRAKNGKEIIVADTNEEIISACTSLLENADLRAKLSGEAQLFVQSGFDWQHTTQMLTELIRNHQAAR